MKIGTHSNIAKIASRLLDNPSTTPLVRIVAGSALTQSKNPSETTSARAASAASQIMQDGRYSDAAHKVAASVLAQRKS
jgi:hypothetical protein